MFWSFWKHTFEWSWISCLELWSCTCLYILFVRYFISYFISPWTLCTLLYKPIKVPTVFLMAMIEIWDWCRLFRASSSVILEVSYEWYAYQEEHGKASVGINKCQSVTSRGQVFQESLVIYIGYELVVSAARCGQSSLCGLWNIWEDFVPFLCLLLWYLSLFAGDPPICEQVLKGERMEGQIFLYSPSSDLCTWKMVIHETPAIKPGYLNLVELALWMSI